MSDRLLLRPKVFSLRGGLGPLLLCIGMAAGAAVFYRQGMQHIAGIVGILALAFSLLTLTHLASSVQVDRDGVRLRTLFSNRLLSWQKLQKAEISSVRASSPFVNVDVEKTLSLDGPEGHISVNLTMWSGFADLERIVRSRRYGGDYELYGSGPVGGG